MARRKNVNWGLPEGSIGYDAAALAVLMDIRDELQTIQIALQPLQHLRCPNFLAIPHKLDRVVRNTTKRRRRKGATK